MPKFKHGTLIRLGYQVALYDSGSMSEIPNDAGNEYVVVEPYDAPDDERIVYLVEGDEFSNDEGGSFTAQDVLWTDDLDAIEVIGPFA